MTGTSTPDRPADVIREVAERLVKARELNAEVERLMREVDALSARLVCLVEPGTVRHFRTSTYHRYTSVTEVLRLERYRDDEFLEASLVAASDPGSLTWPEPEPAHTVNPEVPLADLVAQVAAVIDDDAA